MPNQRISTTAVFCTLLLMDYVQASTGMTTNAIGRKLTPRTDREDGPGFDVRKDVYLYAKGLRVPRDSADGNGFVDRAEEFCPGAGQFFRSSLWPLLEKSLLEFWAMSSWGVAECLRAPAKELWDRASSVAGLDEVARTGSLDALAVLLLSLHFGDSALRSHAIKALKQWLVQELPGLVQPNRWEELLRMLHDRNHIVLEPHAMFWEADGGWALRSGHIELRFLVL